MALQVWLPLNGSINNHGLSDATINSSGVTYTDGKLGKAATFSNSYIGIKGTPITGNITDFSFAFWLKNTNASNTACLYNGRTTTGGACGIFILSSSLRFDDGGQHGSLYKFPVNEWKHCCITRNSKNINIYIDGILVNTVASVAFTTTATNATIGASSVNNIIGSGNTFNGQINDYRIYDHCLSICEIKEIVKGMVCHYPLNDSYAIDSEDNAIMYDKVVYDVSGFGNHGYITDATKPTLSSDSPRYDKSYLFDNKHYITGKSPFGTSNASVFTISFWVNQISGGKYSTVLSLKGYGGSGLWLAINTEGSGLWGYIGANSPSYVKIKETIPTNTWVLFTYVFNDGVAAIYKNGIKVSSDVAYTKKYIVSTDNFILGDNYTGTSWDTSFKGMISDFRIYATALSEKDILELYNSPIALTDTGVLMTQGEFKEV